MTKQQKKSLFASIRKAAKEGFVTTFYIGFLAELYLRVLGTEGVKKAERLYLLYDNPELNISLPPNFYEKYMSKPPYEGIGAPMSAVTIAAVNRIRLLLDQF